MSEPYMPTTEEVRAVFVEAAEDEALSVVAEEAEGQMVSLSASQIEWISDRFGGGFDRWLAQRDREVIRESWDKYVAECEAEGDYSHYRSDEVES